ncbi:ABC transporter substrate-binding protein [Paenibacillus aurantiacus]|uniref:ABC transporter substrate-binding protein n=1 Tax=Paenibacillus aurantiacus TaxID=1936118 RepID=A0ABV5KS73_9BACL
MRRRPLWSIFLSLIAFCIASIAAYRISNIYPNKTKDVINYNVTTSTEKVEGKVDISKQVKLKMYLIGERPKDFDLVYGEVNKLLKQDINATLEISFIPESEWLQEYPSLLNTNGVDLIFTASWSQYSEEAKMGSFMEITKEMLDIYMPLSASSIYPEAWEQAEVNGKVYMIPHNYKDVQGNFTMLRGDLLKKYGLEVEDVMKDTRSIEKYYEAFSRDSKMLLSTEVVASLKGMPVYIPSEEMKNWFEIGGTGNYRIYYDNTQDSPQVFPYIETDAYSEGIAVMKEWIDKGWITNSSSVNTSFDLLTEFLNGRIPAISGNLKTMNSYYITANIRHPEWEVSVEDSNYRNSVNIQPFTEGGISIPRLSNNPERAMMLLDLFRNDERYFNLTTYGIEGEHYEVILGTKDIITPPHNRWFAQESLSTWGWRDDNLYKTVFGSIPNFEQYRVNMLATAVIPKLQSFIFNDSSVKHELASIANVLDQYEKPLLSGIIKKTVNTDIEVLRARLKEAGTDKVIFEIQKQVDAYLDGGIK